MDIKRFKKGGVHPEECKYSKDLPITNAPLPKIVKIPMSQHLGAPAKVIVKQGDEVVEGQLIGEANGFISSNIHSSVSGKVVSIEKGNTINAKGVDIVTIETGGIIKNWYEKKYDYSQLKPEELVNEIKNAGIVGLGGATFPTHVKLSPPKDKKIDILIANGAECEPYLTIDNRMMIEKTDEIIEGIYIIMKILSARKAYIGIENNKPEAIEIFNKKLGNNKEIEVIPLRTRYPQGGEKQLIEAITGKQVPTKGLPMDIGVVVENVSTIYAIYEAIVYKKPLIERGITYNGEDVKNRGNYKVRIGTPIKTILDEYGIPENHGPIISGGPMMGIEIQDLNVPITKGTSGITVLPKYKDYEVKNRPCIRCAKCIFVCPIGLQPTELAKLCDNLFIEDAVNSGLLDCIECGCCAYICPSSIPIVGLIRYGKEFWKRKQTKK